ncbi:hypothetical protein FBU59_000483 [Linderina macrospora]|uniref:Uncharacterized protein n=1 Tax=Linderina macrospora TaxID=4868 RepID=A0ACC1JGH4_9FUNG|nr:hypothetical protein FBU59_000483 [Linderina macrospora]
MPRSVARLSGWKPTLSPRRAVACVSAMVRRFVRMHVNSLRSASRSMIGRYWDSWPSMSDRLGIGSRRLSHQSGGGTPENRSLLQWLQISSAVSLSICLNSSKTAPDGPGALFAGRSSTAFHSSSAVISWTARV